MKLIDKDKLLKEIEKLVDKGKYNEEYDCAYRDGTNAVLHVLKKRLDTLEVKDVKEDEQQLTDNVELKFHEGDWIVSNMSHEDYRICKILKIENGEYVIESIYGYQGHNNFETFDKDYHLWTIKDAKTGDVLADEYNNIGIYREEKSPTSVSTDGFWESYIYLGCDNWLRGFGGYHEYKNTKPATKKQRDLLFKKMKESGYEWNTEKKELKKIEQKPNNSQFTPEQADILDKHIDNFLGQKSAWSEDDEEMWIDAIKYLELFDAQGIHGDVAVPCIEWLKFIKDRVQPKQEWSVDDYSKVQRICKYLDEVKKYYADITEVRECIDWLKYLRPANNWKPSKEQMNALAEALSLAKNCGEESAFDLRTLYEQLKKLKGE